MIGVFRIPLNEGPFCKGTLSRDEAFPSLNKARLTLDGDFLFILTNLNDLVAFSPRDDELLKVDFISF